jgi:hypothetical protein
VHQRAVEMMHSILEEEIDRILVNGKVEIVVSTDDLKSLIIENGQPSS